MILGISRRLRMLVYSPAPLGDGESLFPLTVGPPSTSPVLSTTRLRLSICIQDTQLEEAYHGFRVPYLPVNIVVFKDPKGLNRYVRSFS